MTSTTLITIVLEPPVKKTKANPIIKPEKTVERVDADPTFPLFTETVVYFEGVEMDHQEQTGVWL